MDINGATTVTDNQVVNAADTGTLIMGTDGSNYQILKVNSDGELAINLETTDIEIGAVEIKNSTDDTRATVGANGLYVDVQNTSLTVDSELPVAAAITDNFANPTTTNVMGMGMWYDGVTWDRARGDSTDGLLVNLGTNNDVTVAGVATAANQLPDGHNVTVDNASGASAVNIQDGGNSITIDGTVTANLSATDNAVLDSIDTAVNGTLTVGSHAVTNAGTFAIQISDTSFAIADGNALGEGILVQGDDGTDRKNINVDATTGDVQVDVTNTVTVDLGANNDVTNTVLSVVGGGTQATAQRVTIASDSTGVLSVDDNGGSLTVDGTVTANLSATDNAVLDSIDAAVNGTLVVDLGVNNDVTVTGSALTALQLIDDPILADNAAFTFNTTKVMMAGAVRDDVLSTLTPVEGDAVPLRVNSTGALHVTGGGGGTEYTSDAASPTNPVGATTLIVRDDALATQETADDDWTVLRGNARGALWVEIDPSNALDVSAATLTVNAHAVTNAGTFVVQENGAALTALQLIDDSIFADDAPFTLASSKTTVAGAIRDDTLTTLTAVEGDVVPFRVSSTGALHVTGGGGGTEYTEDVATANPQVGTATMMERDDALTTVTPIEGDWIGLRGTAEGALWTQDFNSDAILADTANMDTNLGTIAGAVTGTEMQVDVVAALPAGTNAIGKLAANTGVDIGDVDVTSSALPTGAATAANQLADGHNVTVDNASGVSAVNIQDGGNSITIDGTVTANLSATDNTVLDNIDSNTDFGTLQATASTGWKYADINDAVNGNNTIIAAQGVGNKIAVWSILIVSDGTTDVRWEDGAAGTAFTGQVPLQAREGYTYSAGGLTPLFVGTANTLLNLELTAAVNVHGSVAYTVVT